MTRYSHTITAACPASLRADANQLACVLGTAIVDLETYPEPQFERDGVVYSVVSFAATDEMVIGAMGGVLSRPLHDIDEVIDMVAAQRAMDAMTVVVRSADGEFVPVLAQSNSLVAYVDFEPLQAIQLLGLSMIPAEDEA